LVAVELGSLGHSRINFFHNWTLHEDGLFGTTISFINLRWESQILLVMDKSAIQAAPASLAEWLVFFISQFLIQTAHQSLVVDAHRFQETHFKFLTITTQLGCQSVSLAL